MIRCTMAEVGSMVREAVKRGEQAEARAMARPIRTLNKSKPRKYPVILAGSFSSIAPYIALVPCSQ